MSGWALSFINCVEDSMGVKTHCPFGRMIMGYFYHLFHVYVTWIRNWLQVYHFDKQDWSMVAGLCHHHGNMPIQFWPFKPHFYIVKLGFTGVYIIFLIFLKNIDCGYSLEPPRRGGSNEYPQSMFWEEIWNISEFFIWKFFFFGCKICNVFE